MLPEIIPRGYGHGCIIKRPVEVGDQTRIMSFAIAQVSNIPPSYYIVAVIFGGVYLFINVNNERCRK